MTTDHANILKYTYTLARDLVIWMAIAMLIFRELQSPIFPIPIPCQCEKVQGTKATESALNFQSNTFYGDVVILGNAKVQGCILWQQVTGIYQNSCTVFQEIGKSCIHGIWQDNSCQCTLHWEGALCDRHDCFGHGIYDLARGICQCNGQYLTAGFCEFEGVFSPCDGPRCFGECMVMDGIPSCVCTRPGQLGTECKQCAYPVIGNTDCPLRTNWGIEFVDINTQFAVCGGGYVEESPLLLLMAGLNCKKASCLDFHQAKYTCCLVTNMSNTPPECMDWIYTPYSMTDFLETDSTVFNTGYQNRYLNIIESHKLCIEEENCLINAYREIQRSDWSQLQVDQVVNNARHILLNDYSLGLGKSGGTFAEAIWKRDKTVVYLEGSGIYQETDQLVYIIYYAFPDIYCLGDRTNDFAVLYVGPNLYWKNLRDQPGKLLPRSYCGQFTKDLKSLDSFGYSYLGSIGSGRAILQNTSTEAVLLAF